MKRPASGRKNTKSKSSSTDPAPKIPVSAWSRAKLALCFESGGNLDLETPRVYRVVSDPDALREGLVRIIDESGEDYLYPSDWFVPLNLSKLSKSVLLAHNSDLILDTKRIAQKTVRPPEFKKPSETQPKGQKLRQPKRTPVVKPRTS